MNSGGVTLVIRFDHKVLVLSCVVTAIFHAVDLTGVVSFSLVTVLKADISVFESLFGYVGGWSH